MHLEITLVFKDALWSMGKLTQFIAARDCCEVFIHQDSAVLACHVFFIGFILVKHMIRTFIKGAYCA